VLLVDGPKKELEVERRNSKKVVVGHLVAQTGAKAPAK